ncbi:transposase [Ochrobactrum sp. LMG 5442]|nr:transposase [Ochrobactrum sp. LMG 5442]
MIIAARSRSSRDSAASAAIARRLISSSAVLLFVVVVPNNPTRKQIRSFDPIAYRQRNIIECTFCRLKDWRRVATQYDKLMINFAATCYIAAIVTWWIN